VNFVTGVPGGNQKVCVALQMVQGNKLLVKDGKEICPKFSIFFFDLDHVR
jgi:hypothetical protein